MFRNLPDVEQPAREVVRAEPVPLSHLALDLDVPVEGWALFLGRRAIAIIPDSLGRDSVGHDAARRLLDERRAEDLRKDAHRRRQEQEAVEADRALRASIGVGVPTSVIPADQSYAEAALAAQLNDLEYRPRRTSLMEEVFSNSPEMTIHPLEREEVDWQ
jgi:hypothetical protein